MPEPEYLTKNKISWNNRVSYHLSSSFYDVNGFLQGKNTLNPIELELLGDLRGKTVLHLQCHFGLDTLSLARLGAVATGVDFSENAIKSARELAQQTYPETTFICSDIYELPAHFKEKYDIVFTSYGTVGWLPDLSRWADVIACFLKPVGQFIMADFHPVVWMFDENFQSVAYAYDNKGPIRETIQGTYADPTAPIADETISWNHSLSEIITSLNEAGLCLKSFHEFDYSPYNCFKGMEEALPGKFRLRNLGDKIPLVYSIKATRNTE